MNREHQRLMEHLKGVRKVVINNCHGGFGLSHEAICAYLDKCGTPYWVESNKLFSKITPYTYYLVPPEERIEGTPDNWHAMSLQERAAHNAAYSKTVFTDRDLARDDPYLVAVVEELGEAANGRFAELKVIEMPADVNWDIEEYDGSEWVAERHRTWR